jgi:hypothetical protein
VTWASRHCYVYETIENGTPAPPDRHSRSLGAHLYAAPEWAETCGLSARKAAGRGALRQVTLVSFVVGNAAPLWLVW